MFQLQSIKPSKLRSNSISVSLFGVGKKKLKVIRKVLLKTHFGCWFRLPSTFSDLPCNILRKKNVFLFPPVSPLKLLFYIYTSKSWVQCDISRRDILFFKVFFKVLSDSLLLVVLPIHAAFSGIFSPMQLYRGVIAGLQIRSSRNVVL